MVTAATASAAPSANDKEHARRPWTPDGNDHLIFQWVKMQGKTQCEVASLLNIDQSTVSRVIQRYERWQAHAKEREGGRLDHSERLRAQRWLTFERNELILSSCLRIAHEMEGFIDTSKSTIRRPASSPSQETEVSTQHATIDRSGVAARFLRLAFRINMEQLKLAELDPPPPAEPLTDEELADQDRDAAAAAEEITEAQRREAERSDEDESSRPTPFAVAHPEQEEVERQTQFDDAEPLGAMAGLPSSAARSDPSPVQSSQNEAAQPAAAAALHNVHNLHNAEATEFGATPAEPCSCLSQPCSEKNSPATCITDKEQPPWPNADRPPGAQCRRQTTAAG